MFFSNKKQRMKIAFCGRLASGKTTAANIVQGLIPETKRLSFAARIKELATELYGMDPNVKDRALLQDLGQKLREIDSDVWCNVVINKVPNFSSIVIDDLRFPNEWKALKENGFVIVKLWIDRDTQIKRIKETYPDTWTEHVDRLENISETALDNYKADYNIKSTDLEYMTNCIKEIVVQEQI